MEKIAFINPKRILWCCADRGITYVDLSLELGISESTLNAVVTKGEGLTFKQLQSVAEYFNRGILFFLESKSISAETAHSVQFRSISNQKPELSPNFKNLIERAEEQRDIYVSLLRDLNLNDELNFVPPTISRDLKKAASIVREWLGLNSSHKTFDDYRAAIEAQGILVFRSNGFAGDWQIPKEMPISGFAIYDEICPAILIKKQEADTRQTFTLFHELGHILLHKRSYIDDDSYIHSSIQNEREANTFAGYVLMPDDYINTIGEIGNDVTRFEDQLNGYKNKWGVSVEAILVRLIIANKISYELYEAYRAWRDAIPHFERGGGNRAYRYLEPKNIFGDKFVRVILYALKTREISLNKASSYLDNIKISDVHKLEASYASI